MNKIISTRGIITIAILLLIVVCNIGLSNTSYASSTNTFTFTDSGITASNTNGSGYKIEGTALTISEAGTYTITGSCSEGSIKVKKETTGVTLILKDLNLTCSTTAPISLNKSTETTIEISGTVSLTDKEDLSTEETNEDFEGACIKVKSGATLNLKGTGTLNIDGTACKNGIKGGATSKISIDGNITFNIKVAKNGLAADGSMVINGGTFNVEAEDAIKCDPDDDDTESLAELTINGGTYNLKANSDGVRANAKLEINGGTFDITAGEGLEATYVLINDGTINISASDDGINASDKSTRYAKKVEINGGNITIKMGQGDTDAIDSNGDLIITGGTLNITAQFAFDYDGKVTFTGGDVTVNGEKVTTISNSMMFGRMGQRGERPDRRPSGEKMPQMPNNQETKNASSWAKEELEIAHENKLIPESLENLDLTKSITREEFAKIAIKLYEALTGSKVDEVKEKPFTDTNDADVLKAYKLGITNGTTATTFSPNKLITREEMATMMTRTIEKSGIDVSDSNSNIKFDDDEEMHEWGRAPIYFMANNEIIQGVGNNKFNVKGNATREQAIIIANRAVEKLKN